MKQGDSLPILKLTLLDAAAAAIDARTGTLNFDAQSANFTVGLVVTGGTSGAKGTIVSQTDAGTTGTLVLNLRNAIAFVDNEALTDSSTGAAVVNGASAAPTVKFRMRQVNSGTPANTLKVNREMTNNTTGADGKVNITLTSSETDTPGIFQADVQITTTDGVQTVPSDSFITVHITAAVGSV